jgi:hypothetical protein
MGLRRAGYHASKRLSGASRSKFDTGDHAVRLFLNPHDPAGLRCGAFDTSLADRDFELGPEVDSLLENDA